VPVYLAYRGVVGTFRWSLLWSLAFPLVIGIVGWIMVGLSWWMASRRKFHYDDERQESSWIEAGETFLHTQRLGNRRGAADRLSANRRAEG
jgi:hypothetical protein